MDDNPARCAAGFKSVDILSETIAIAGVEPVTTGAVALLMPKEKSGNEAQDSL